MQLVFEPQTRKHPEGLFWADAIKRDEVSYIRLYEGPKSGETWHARDALSLHRIIKTNGIIGKQKQADFLSVWSVFWWRILLDF